MESCQLILEDDLGKHQCGSMHRWTNNEGAIVTSLYFCPEHLPIQYKQEV